MNMNEAMAERHSVRKYTGEPIPQEKEDALRAEIARINEETGLDIRLVTDDPKGLSGVICKVAGFSGVPAYIAMCGRDSPELNETVGYQGEKLVLLAQTLGLRTCWAMICSKKAVEAVLPQGERMVIGIAVGVGADDGKPHKSKPVERVADMDGAPIWFMKGVEAALLAPTGMNKQAFHLSCEGESVKAEARGGWMTQVDLGIVKLHFELGVGKPVNWL